MNVLFGLVFSRNKTYLCAAQYWEGVSETARSFVRSCLTIDQKKRPTAEEALAHPWLSATTPHFVPDPESAEGKPTNLLPGIRKAFDAKKTCQLSLLNQFLLPTTEVCSFVVRKAVLSMMAVRRLSMSPHSNDLARTVETYKETAEQVTDGYGLSILLRANLLPR